MSRHRKIDTRDLVDRIAKLTRERMTRESVVNLSQIKKSLEKKIKKSILIIEDDETMRAALERVLSGEGYKLLLADGASELVDLLHDATVDLILLDIGLPWINGLELAEMMKAHADLKNVPLIFISGLNDQKIVKQGFAVGAHDFITKPFDNEVIKKTVRTLLALSPY